MTVRFVAYRPAAPARASLSAAGGELGLESRNARFAPDGRSIVFETLAALLPDDGNGAYDIYERDLRTGALTRWSSGHVGEAGSGATLNARYGAGGLVVFDSDSWNLTPGRDVNGHRDVFVRDRATGALTLVSQTAAGVQGNGESANGVIAPDGRSVLFESLSTNLTGADTNGARDLFLKTLADGAVVRVSVSAAGAQANGQSGGASFSPDGRFVLFESNASNLVEGDTNRAYDLFLKDLGTGAVTRVSLGASGAQANGHSFRASFTPDGRQILFESEASNLVAGDTNGVRDVFLRDLATGVVTRVSERAGGGQLDGASQNASFAAGRVVFESDARNAVPGDFNARRDVFMRDLETGLLHRLSARANGGDADAGSFNGRISPDGNRFLFESAAGNLVGGDGNGQRDLFVVELEQASPSAKVAENGPPASDALLFTMGDGARFDSAWVDAPVGALGRLDVALIAEGGAVPGKLRWTYTPYAVVDSLNDGEERTETYVIHIRSSTAEVATTAFEVTIMGANDAPVALPDSVRLAARGVIDVTDLLLVNDRDVDAGDRLTILSVSGGSAGVAAFDPESGRVTYAATGDSARALAGGATLIDSFTYTVRDLRGATATATVTVTVDGAPETQVVMGTAGADTLAAAGGGPAQLFGLEGRDRLTGSARADLLDGGGGADTMTGGAGDDVYVVDTSSGDVIVELPGGGWDTVRTALAGYRLPAEVEELLLIGAPTAAGFDGRGNTLANRITGSAGPDRLYGFEGDDTLIGAVGRDYLEGGAGADRLDGGAGADAYRGGAGADGFVLRKGEAAGDVIQDFRVADGDRLVLDGWSRSTAFAYDPASRLLTLSDPLDGHSETLTVIGNPSAASLFFG